MGNRLTPVAPSRCVVCDILAMYECQRCDAHFCSLHIQTHLTTRICRICDQQVCIEMFDVFGNTEICFRCTTKYNFDV